MIVKKTLKILFLLAITGPFFTCCSDNNSELKISEECKNSEKQFDSMSKVIDCDSIYLGKKIIIEFFEHDFEKSELNATLKIIKNGEVLIIDSLSTGMFALEFKDFNGDGIKDILAQNSSDARSNYTWYLYLADKEINSFTKIKGFEKIKNPNYLEKYDLIDCLVMSGNDWTSFYQIQNDSIHDFGFVIYMGYNSDKQEYFDYHKEYETTLKKVVTLKKNATKVL